MRLRFVVNYSLDRRYGRSRPDTFTLAMPRPEAPYIGIYETYREYGGPEEGGWWYDAGPLAASVYINPKKKGAARKLRAFARELNERVPCIQGECVLVRHLAAPPLDHYPSVRPHFE